MTAESPEEVWACFDRLACEVLAAAGISEPPVDSGVLARHLGIEIEETSSPARTRGASTIVRVDPDWSISRRHGCIAQVVAKSLRDRVAAQLGEEFVSSSSGWANRLAERILVPQEWFEADCRAFGGDLSELCERYRTADPELLAGRLLINEIGVIVALIDGERVLWRRGNGVRANRQLSPAESTCCQRIRSTRKAQIVRSERWTVQGWPLPDGERLALLSRIEE